MSNCKSCGAEIQWVVMASTGKTMPLNMKKKTIIVMSEKGNYLAQGFESHFATCPNAKQHRKGGS